MDDYPRPHRVPRFCNSIGRLLWPLANLRVVGRRAVGAIDALSTRGKWKNCMREAEEEGEIELLIAAISRYFRL